ncbi:hypothetical protein RhiirA4_453181 [Rhizophagus irregularis]|uniref:Uncharacterized protein n=1 Tax=Rhizophagus irregularis TaxID=588596 RepID=A0A2I1FZX3_9GLOM|nr:hypothetical protein RhiirA4_453181 [Rhizophagus irregularis]
MFKIAILPLTKQKLCKTRFDQLRNLMFVYKRFFNPNNDVAFRKIFAIKQNKPLLLSFLNSILRREGNNIIEEVELLPQNSTKSILNVSCYDKSGYRYIVEMQNKRLSIFIQRLERYVSYSTYSDQLFQNVDYLELKPKILLTILNHKIFPKEIKYISYYSNCEEKTNKCFLPNISYAFIELPKFDKCEEQLKTPEDYWIYLLKEADNKNELPKNAPSEIQAAYKILEIYNWDLADINNYENTMMAILDRNDEIITAIEEGKKEIREIIEHQLLKKGWSSQNISDFYTNLLVKKSNN